MEGNSVISPHKKRQSTCLIFRYTTQLSGPRGSPPLSVLRVNSSINTTHSHLPCFFFFRSSSAPSHASRGGGMDELMQQGALGRMMASLPIHTAVEGAEMQVDASFGGGTMKKEGTPAVGERVPQWSQQETREFIAIRAELERDFNVSKRNKTLWEVVCSRMRERGYRRSPEQCKCKWKNLINRYKGKETSDPDNGRHCPFFDELHAIFTEREKGMQRLLLESEHGGASTTATQHHHLKKKAKRTSTVVHEKSSDEDSVSYFVESEDNSDGEQRLIRRNRKKKVDRDRQQASKTNTSSGGGGGGNGVVDILHDLFEQQRRMEFQWREAAEKRAKERQVFEQDWRMSMEKLERERLMSEQAWREREENRRIREETRAEKRDFLVTTLLRKLLNQDEEENM